MRLLYQLGILFYTGAIHLVSPFNAKARQWVQGRKNWAKKLATALSDKKRVAWFHVSSLGEFEQGRPVIEGFRKQHPEYKIVLSFFSPSGYEIRKDYPGADVITYLPTDSRKNARKFMYLAQPEFAFFVKYDFWYHYLNQLHKRNVPTYLFSAIFRETQLFFKSYGGWYRKMLHFFTRIYVQNQHSLELLQSIGVNHVEVGGDTRFDRVYDLATAAKPITLLEEFAQQKPVVVAGSTWEKDEELIAEFIAKYPGKVKWIVAPHEVHASHIQKIEALFPKTLVRYTQADTESVKHADILLVDTIGVLSSMYRYGNLAYIGGGFGKGIHNTLEAATYGLPVVFGPNYHRFQEAVDLINQESGFSISDFTSFESELMHLLTDETYRKNCGKNAADYVNKMRGGTTKILLHLNAKSSKE